MRIVAYFSAWLLALPGLSFAAAILALHRAIAVANLLQVVWEALFAFAYGLPLVALLALVACIAGFFRMGRVIGSGALLVASLGALAVMLEGFGAPTGLAEAWYLAPTVGSAVLAGWLIHTETRGDPR
jgi:hypothetical protein